MRPISMRRWAPGVFLALVLMAFALPASTQAAPPNPTKKLHPSVRALLADPLVTPFTELRVIVGGDAGSPAIGLRFKRNRKLELIEGESISITAIDLLKLVKRQSVSFVAADMPVEATLGGSVLPPQPSLAALHSTVVGAPDAWNRGLDGRGVGIAVIDSGVTPLADFGSRLVQVSVTGQSTDSVGHGTFAAGVAAGSSADGRYKGIAPGATVYGLNVSRSGGVYTSDVVAALDWVLRNAAANNIRVVNLSLNEAPTSSYLSNILDTSVERLWRAGVVVVVSSGNRGADTASHGPANDPFAITVGALDVNATLTGADDVIPSWSSGGRTLDGFDKPELVAPGRQVVSALSSGTKLATTAPLANLIEPGYAKLNGTSFAAPQVTGAAAILLQQHPEYTPDQVKWLLTQHARTISSGHRALDCNGARELAPDRRDAQTAPRDDRRALTEHRGEGRIDRRTHRAGCTARGRARATTRFLRR